MLEYCIDHRWVYNLVNKLMEKFFPWNGREITFEYQQQTQVYIFRQILAS